MDYQALSNAVGVIAKTIKQRLSVLEASYVVVKLPPYVEKFGKRVVKSPKYFFYRCRSDSLIISLINT